MRLPREGCAGPGPSSTRGAAYKGGPTATVGAVVATVEGSEAERECCDGVTRDSFESGALRREAISTVTVCRLLEPGAGSFPHKGAPDATMLSGEEKGWEEKLGQLGAWGRVEAQDGVLVAVTGQGSKQSGQP